MKSKPTLREQTLSATITTPSGTIAPAYVRMPAPGRCCPITNLRRGVLYELARAGKIKTATLKRKTSTRGVRLISTSSLLAYIASCEDSPDTMDEHELVES